MVRNEKIFSLFHTILFFSQAEMNVNLSNETKAQPQPNYHMQPEVKANLS